jgi:hypothetical protein
VKNLMMCVASILRNSIGSFADVLVAFAESGENHSQLIGTLVQGNPYTPFS